MSFEQFLRVTLQDVVTGYHSVRFLVCVTLTIQTPHFRSKKMPASDEEYGSDQEMETRPRKGVKTKVRDARVDCIRFVLQLVLQRRPHKFAAARSKMRVVFT